MALGKRKQEQQELLVATTSLPQSPGHPFYQKLKSFFQVKKMVMHGPAVYQDIVKEDDDILPEVWLK